MTAASVPGVKAGSLITQLRLVAYIRARRDGEEWLSRCPAHRDRRERLRFRDGKSGLELECLDGCSPDRIFAALGMPAVRRAVAADDPQRADAEASAPRLAGSSPHDSDESPGLVQRRSATAMSAGHRHRLGDWTCPSGNTVEVFITGDAADVSGPSHLWFEWDEAPPLKPEDEAFYVSVVRPEVIRLAQQYLKRPGRVAVVVLR